MISRTSLFIPGNSPGMLLNADIYGADCVIFDLEDAVSLTEKDSSRLLVRNVIEKLRPLKCRVIVRINSLSTNFWEEDLNVVVPLLPDSLMLTKINSAKDIQVFAEYVSRLEVLHQMSADSIKFAPLLETALGIENSFQIAMSSPRIKALYLGAEDLTADLHAKRTKDGKEILYSRSRFLTAARAAGVYAYDTPFTDVNDMDGLYRDAVFAKELGFDGKAVISPRHVDCVNTVFSPTEDDISNALDVMQAIKEAEKQGKGVISLHGRMIDAPIVERARQVLATAQAIRGGV